MFVFRTGYTVIQGMSAFCLDHIFGCGPLAEQPCCWITLPYTSAFYYIEKEYTDYRLRVRSCSTCVFTQHYFVKRHVDIFDSDYSK